MLHNWMAARSSADPPPALITPRSAVGCEVGHGPERVSTGRAGRPFPYFPKVGLLNHWLWLLYRSGFRRRSLALSFANPAVRAATKAGDDKRCNYCSQHSAHQAILSPGAE